jgi:hypothetical protein
LLPLSTPTIVLTLPVIAATGQDVKIDSMSEVEITTASAGSYQYTIVYSLLRDATTLATITVEKDTDSQTAATRVFGEIPNLTWVDTPGAGLFSYTIVITVTGTNIAAADALTRAINAVL